MVCQLDVLRDRVCGELFLPGFWVGRVQGGWVKAGWGGGNSIFYFALGHWTGGAANILIALVLGAILSAFYLWRRDLVANMIGHGTVDFVANVLPNLFS